MIGSATGRRWLALVILASAQVLSAQPFLLPTANRALFERGGEERYFVGTVGKPWTSGCFGCVRSDGWQMHEGLDIAPLQHDRHGEATDPVLATAGGTVAYVNAKSGLSNYGNYILLRHAIDGLEVYSLYAHLSAVRVRPGQAVQAGEVIGTMGRTANTHEGISKDRAHLHFELNLLANPNFASWFRKHAPGQRNDHGTYNGQNMLGFDPRAVLLVQRQVGASFSLLQFLRVQTELCRVAVRDPNLPWVRRYPALARRNPVAEKEGVAGYELALSSTGLPFEIIPRAASELKGSAKIRLLSVNEAEQAKHPCGRIVTRKSTGWQLTSKGDRLLDLVCY
jgi:murein DD-endopeptidase MepM/ murein hydrolase activator NlpD